MNFCYFVFYLGIFKNSNKLGGVWLFFDEISPLCGKNRYFSGRFECSFGNYCAVFARPGFFWQELRIFVNIRIVYFLLKMVYFWTRNGYFRARIGSFGTNLVIFSTFCCFWQ